MREKIFEIEQSWNECLIANEIIEVVEAGRGLVETMLELMWLS